MTLQALIDDPGLRRVILVEVHPFDLGLAAEIVLGFSAGADAPVYNGHLWHERIATSYATNTTITQSGFDLGGFTTPTYGVVTFKVGDGSSFTDSLGVLKDLRTLSWDGRRVRILIGSPEDDFAAFEVIFDGLIEDFTWDETNFTLSIRDKTTKLDDEMQIVTFAGTGGLEGGADVKNLIKPLVFGVRRNIVPVLVDSLNQIYVVNEGSIQAVDDVFDNAVQLINAGDIVTLGLPALVNWTPEGGRYITDLAQGAIRLGAEPAGVLTMDVQGDNSGTGFIAKTADIIERILLTKGGFVAADIDSPSFTQFNLDFPGSAGVYVKDDVTIRTVINDLLLNLNAFGITTPEGKVEIGVVGIDVPGITVDQTLPTVDSTLFTADQTQDLDAISAVFEDRDIVSIVRQETANPVWKTEVGFKKIGRVQEVEDTEIPDNVASDPFNLLKGQLLVTQETGDFTYADKISLAIDLQQEVLPGDVLSIGLEVEDPTANVTSVRVQVLFFDAVDAQVGSTVEGNFINTATTFIRSFIFAFTVPLSAAKITIRTLSATNGTDVLSRRVMLNRGTIALPFIPSSDAGPTSDLVNLLRNQVLLTENVGDFTYVNLIPLATAFQQEILIGDTLSIAIEFEDPTANVTSLRLQVQFFTAADAQIGATLEGNFITGAATFERSIIDNFDVPATAVKITIKTFSATNGADVLSRRLILNRGTLALDFIPSITDALNDDTVLPAGVVQTEGVSTHSLGIGLSVGSANDGDAVTFAVPWTAIPAIIPVGGALTNNVSLTGDQELVFKALNLTTTGFTASVKNEALVGGSPTVITDTTESTPTDTVDEQIDKSVVDEAANDAYTITVSITVTDFLMNGDPVMGSASIGFYSFKNGVGWTKRAEVTYFSSGSKSQTIVVDGLNSTADKWGAKLESSSFGGQSLNDIVQVTYSFGGTQPTESATPAGAGKINFLVIGGAEGGT